MPTDQNISYRTQPQKRWWVNRYRQPIRYWIARGLLEVLWNFQLTLLICLAILVIAMLLKWAAR